MLAPGFSKSAINKLDNAGPANIHHFQVRKCIGFVLSLAFKEDLALLQKDRVKALIRSNGFPSYEKEAKST